MWLTLGIIVGFVLGVITHLIILKSKSNRAAREMSDNISDNQNSITETLDRMLREAKDEVSKNESVD